MTLGLLNKAVTGKVVFRFRSRFELRTLPTAGDNLEQLRYIAAVAVSHFVSRGLFQLRQDYEHAMVI